MTDGIHCATYLFLRDWFTNKFSCYMPNIDNCHNAAYTTGHRKEDVACFMHM